MNALDWVAIVCAGIIFASAIGRLVYRLLTGPRPSAGEVATAQQIAATPAHPSGKGHLSARERRECEALEHAWDLPAVTDAERITPRRPS